MGSDKQSMKFYIFLMLGLAFDSSSLWAQPKVEGGEIVLSGLVESGRPITKLEGNWHFYWKQFLQEEQLKAGALDKGAFVAVTSKGPAWPDIPEIGQKHGYGTYVLRLKDLHADAGQFTIVVTQFFGTHTLAVWQPSKGIYRKLGEKGHPGQTREEDRPAYGKTLGVIDFPLDGSDVFIILHCSAYYLIGSLSEPPELVNSSYLEEVENIQWANSFWILGLFSMLLVSNISLFLLRRDDFPSLMVAVYTFFSTLRFLATEGVVGHFMDHPPQWVFYLTVYSIGWTFPLALASYLSFFYYSFPGFIKPWPYRLGLLALVSFMVLTVALDLDPNSGLFLVGIILTTLFGYIVFQQIRAALHGMRGAGLSLLGLSILLVGVGHDALLFMGVIESIYIGHFTMVVFIFFQSLVVAKNFSMAFQTARRLSKSLQDEVQLQTAQLQDKNRLLEEQKKDIASAHDIQRNWNRYLEEQVLRRFLPSEIAQDIAQGKITLFEAPVEVNVTVIFADLCAFTSATEKIGAEKIGQILNDYFVAMTETVFSEGGMVDKFIGDGVMAVFGVPGSSQPEVQARQALRCAIAMQQALWRLNETWKVSHGQSFSMRVGIHQGAAVFGNFGGKKRSDFTVIGPAVNLAARIEAVAEPGSIFISRALYELLSDSSFEFVGSFHLKGLQLDQDLYRVKLSLQGSHKDPLPAIAS